MWSPRDEHTREELRWLARSASQAAAPLVLLLVVIELLRREGVVTTYAFAPVPLMLFAITWLVMTAYRGLRNQA